MNTTTGQKTPADSASVKALLDETDLLLKQLISRTRRENMVTMIVGTLALVVLGGYFAYGYSEIASMLVPKTLIGAAESWIEEQLPQVRKAIEAEVEKSAPSWAENLSHRAQSSLPMVRGKLEDYVLQQVDKSVEEAVTLTEEHFRKLLRDKREFIEEGFNDLASNPELAKESLERLEDAMSGVFESDMKQGAAEVFATLNLMTTKLARLKEGHQLNPEETRERAVLMQLRRLQSEPTVTQAGP